MWVLMFGEWGEWVDIGRPRGGVKVWLSVGFVSIVRFRCCLGLN